ncbi:MAG: hypothetical protein IJT53_07510 [Prevotella sp.]|nr:hypothetical protein [Prevotella sp.]
MLICIIRFLLQAATARGRRESRRMAYPSPSCVPLVASARKRSSGREGSAMRLARWR